MKRWVLRPLLLFALIIGGLIVAERFIIYAFDPRQISPAKAGVPQMKERIFTAPDGKELVLWTVPARKGKPTVLYLHGNAGNLTNRVPRFRLMIRRGYGIIAVGHRGGSGSQGWPVQRRIEKDVRAVYYATLKGQITGKPVLPVIYGESIGAAMAIHLNGGIGQSTPPRAIILEAPFTSLKDVAHALQPGLLFATGLMQNQWRNIDYANQITVPLLVIHGDQDGLIPVEHGRAIHAAAKSRDKTFYAIKGGGHLNVWNLEGQRRVFRFLDRF